MRRALRLLLFVTLLAPVAPARAAGGCYSSLPVTDPHSAHYVCAGVHPGMTLLVKSAKSKTEIECSASFAFTDSAKNKYLSLPGTCVLDYDCLEDLIQPYPPPLDQLPIPALPTCTLPQDSEAEPYYKKGTGPIVKDGAGARIGRLAYAVNKKGVDWALVRLDPGVKLDPAVPLYGGPVRSGAAGLTPQSAHAYCAGFPGAMTVNAFSGLVYALGPDQAFLVANGWLANLRGGSVLTDDGTAIGMTTGPFYVGEGYGVQPLGPAVGRLADHVGLHVTLLTAPLAS